MGAKEAGEGVGAGEGTDQRQVQPVGEEEIPGGGADLAGGDLAQAALDLGGRHNPAVTQELLAHPIHLAIGAFQAEINLTDDVVPGAPDLGGAGGGVPYPTQLAQDEPEHFLGIIGVQAGRNHQVTGVAEEAGRAVDRVSQAAVLQ